MAPVKFGLFKTRSRDHQEQPSTENLLQSNSDHETPECPVPSTSKGYYESGPDISELHLDSEDDDGVSEKATPARRISDCSRLENTQINYQPLENHLSADATSTSTLHDDEDDDYGQIQHFDDPFEGLENSTLPMDPDQDGASTSCDANSSQFDETSLAPSEDLSVYCGTLRKPKKSRSKEDKKLMKEFEAWELSNLEAMYAKKSRSKEEKQLIKDFDMWRASNVEVMQHLLRGSGTHDEQIKWEAIATARGLCTLTDSCTCGDCTRAKYLAGVTDGDGGLGAAPLFSAISVGCTVQ